MTADRRPLGDRTPTPAWLEADQCTRCWGSGEGGYWGNPDRPDYQADRCGRCWGYGVEPEVVNHGDHWHWAYGDEPGRYFELGRAVYT